MNFKALTAQEIEAFIERGFVALQRAFPRSLADEAVAILWRDTGCNPLDPSTWTKPVVRLGDYAQPPFAQAANTPRLHRAFDELVGPLARAGEDGLSLRELAANEFSETSHRPEELARGDAGTVYLCHPFLVHAAQPHRGTRPRFMAQPPLLPAVPCQLSRVDGLYSPVELAIRAALDDGSD